MQNGDYKSVVRFDLKNYVNLDDDDIEYATVGMPNCVITNSNYIVNEYNNVFTVSINATNYTYTLAKGNYTKTTWSAYLQTILNSIGLYFTISADNTTNKFTITTTALFQSTYPAATWGFSGTCDYIWGFRTSFSTASTSYIMDRCFNFLPIARFIFHCNILSSGLTLTTNSSVSSCDILAVIPNSSKLNSQIIYENNAGSFLVKSNSHISSITISITDDDNRILNFNGISCYFSIQFNLFRRSIQRPLKFTKLVEKANDTKGQYTSNVVIEE